MNQVSLPLFDDNYIKGTLEREVYHNEETWYSVLLIRVHESSGSGMNDGAEVMVVGNMPRIHPDEGCTFYGHWKEHPKYGKQFAMDRYEKTLPKTPEGIVRYLCSGIFKGIGRKTAETIVRHLGIDALTIITDDAEMLNNIPGITKIRAKTILTSLYENREMEQAFVYLYQFEISPAIAAKIYNVYRHDTLAILQSSPYRLIEDVNGIGFIKADAIGQSLGIDFSAIDRIRAAILFTLQESVQAEGHVFLPKNELILRANQLLHHRIDLNATHNQSLLSEEVLTDEILQMEKDEIVKTDEDSIYLPSLYWAEYGFVGKFHALMNQKIDPFPFFEIYAVMGQLEEKFNVTYASEQREAMEVALQSPIMILTGGPGTGKTTVIRGICHLFSELHQWSLNAKQYDENEPFPIRLAAPTGRAAKRMTETTGLPASTIHRLLGWQGESFIHDSENPLTGKLLIVDETSMLDIWLANQLFRAIPKGMQVILVGDPDQLPSVGPGLVLRNLIDSGKVPSISLNEVFRQEEGSSIIRLAHEIKSGTVSERLQEALPDRRFFTCEGDQVAAIVQKICLQSLKRGLTKSDIQVLAPIYSGNAGVDRLNEVLQDVFNPLKPNQRTITHRGIQYRIGDKVLQLSNQMEHHVFNGDIGIIESIELQTEDEDHLVVNFDGNLVNYSKSEMNQLTLAYATTIHKAQGSEYKVVVMPIVRSYARMLQRNLIYTGITRAKEYLLLCGDPYLFRKVCRNQQPIVRNTKLLERYQQMAEAKMDEFDSSTS